MWKAVDVVFEVLNPGNEFDALVRRNARGLMGQIGGDVAIGKDQFPLL